MESISTLEAEETIVEAFLSQYDNFMDLDLFKLDTSIVSLDGKRNENDPKDLSLRAIIGPTTSAYYAKLFPKDTRFTGEEKITNYMGLFKTGSYFRLVRCHAYTCEMLDINKKPFIMMIPLRVSQEFDLPKKRYFSSKDEIYEFYSNISRDFLEKTDNCRSGIVAEIMKAFPFRINSEYSRYFRIDFYPSISVSIRLEGTFQRESISVMSIGYISDTFSIFNIKDDVIVMLNGKYEVSPDLLKRYSRNETIK